MLMNQCKRKGTYGQNGKLILKSVFDDMWGRMHIKKHMIETLQAPSYVVHKRPDSGSLRVGKGVAMSTLWKRPQVTIGHLVLTSERSTSPGHRNKSTQGVVN